MKRVLPIGLLLLSVAAIAWAQAPDPRGLPLKLSDTGLADAAVLKRRIEFRPQYPLWSDGATKRRWIWLPPGSFIDASNPDAWEFPRGTRLWKEFSHGDAIETRYIERAADGRWRYGSYVWNAEGTEATLVPAAGFRDLAAPGAPGGRYAIPAENDCRACHEGAPVPVLGFSALQLSPDRAVDLRTLSESGLLRNLPATVLVDPPHIAAANARERAVLGYLHGNCGHCHNDDGPLAVLELNLSQRIGAPPDAVRRSIVGVPSQLRAGGVPPGTPRVQPGHVSASVLALRMGSRDPLQQMPPLGTSLVDAEAMALLGEWIASLPSP
jgi:hypothetical protein